MEKCVRCKGEGWIWVACGKEGDDVDKDICLACEGKGYIEETEAEEEADYEYREYISQRIEEAKHPDDYMTIPETLAR